MKKICFYLGLLILGSVLISGCGSTEKQVTVGGKNYTEQELMVEIVRQTIEGNSDIKVVPKPFLGGTGVIDSALEKGDIDIAVEYTGTALLHVLKQPVNSDPEQVFKIVSSEYKSKKNITWLDPLGFNNTYAIVMRGDQATELGIKSISDLSNHAPGLRFTGTPEFLERPDGFPGVKDLYQLKFKQSLSMDPGLMYGALKNSETDLISAFATDGRIPAFGLVVLEDDKGFFPPYYAAPLIRTETLQKYPELEGILGKLVGQLSDDEMAKLNAQVDLEGKTAKEVAETWLKSKGIIK